MIIPKSISEQLLYSTLRLKIGNSTATGFFYQVNTIRKSIIVISNRHFAEQVENLSQLDYNKNRIVQNTEFTIHLDDGTNCGFHEEITWHLHPTEDLAFFDLSSLLKGHPLPQGKKYLCISIPASSIPTQAQLNDLLAVEQVVMVGYPNGLYDCKNNYPIFRSGTTASHPAIDYNGKKMALLDMACLPGSSGSPVFILNEGYYYSKNGSLNIASRVYFLGVENSMATRVSSSIYKKVELENGALEYIPTDEYIVQDDMNLGYYIKSSELDGFKNQISNLNL